MNHEEIYELCIDRYFKGSSAYSTPTLDGLKFRLGLILRKENDYRYYTLDELNGIIDRIYYYGLQIE